MLVDELEFFRASDVVGLSLFVAEPQPVVRRQFGEVLFPAAPVFCVADATRPAEFAGILQRALLALFEGVDACVPVFLPHISVALDVLVRSVAAAFEGLFEICRFFSGCTA